MTIESSLLLALINLSSTCHRDEQSEISLMPLESTQFDFVQMTSHIKKK